ncbi:RNAse R [Desulfonispora thiosulfatigenes DSM 11270]|uniref:Ribonuclease R n=1 Tax=Desulfonispora thiosulfatigenes DSM 11270 TaxID=656914 RepID=A0A1W1UW34_DESTI|nr:ribonuclease R [Desulfonispora thiosulfatigenes]SMB85246.1 RNAse R [Desulfonispora thiosulfatigenes DSM 11270]
MTKREEILDFMATAVYHPLTREELVSHFGVEKKDLDEFIKNLDDMEAQGEIIVTRKDRYALPKLMNLVTGRLQGHSKGFAFLIPDDPDQGDVYVKSQDLDGAMHNDRVIVRMHKSRGPGKKPEGEVIRITERANKQVVGTFENNKHFGFVVPDDNRLGYDFFISKEDFAGAKDGMKVVIEVIKWPEKRRNPEGRVVSILGYKGSPGVDILSIIKKHQLPERFPPEVMEKAEKISLNIPDIDKEGRRDLRDLPLVTIDGADAKDLDDAVSLEILANGLRRLGVHIADVGHYVPEDSVIDKEAIARATSVYLVDRVIPMLPVRLSNGICSLNANEDRLAMTCFMDIDDKGNVVSHEICESIINVKERLTYGDVYKILVEDDQELITRYQDYVATFKEMEKLCRILQEKRTRRGSINFDFPESKVKLDEDGKPIEIILRRSTIAEQIIEEFMICANETVAERYFWLEVPFLYRIHEEPNFEDIAELNGILNVFGYNLKGVNNEIHPKAFQEIIDLVEDKPEKRVINTVVLRSMQHARYAADALGHFGLASKYYSHFTSPIRRYPDLAIHRIIKEMIKKENKLDKSRLAKLKKKVNYYADQSSLRERIAEDAERESVDLKKVEYMKQFEGQEFKGNISSVTSFGLFVELENSVEGLVHVSTLTDDFYIFNDRDLSLLGEHTKKTYRIGQEVEVLLTRVNMEDRKIDFELIEQSN